MRPAIVLLHGQPDFSISFWPLRAALRGRLGSDLEIVVPDRPGYGVNPSASTDFAGNAEWLERLLRRSGLGPVVLVGHSWSGGVALLTAARGRADVAGLVTLASIGPQCLLPIDPWLASPVLGEVLSYASLKLGRRILIRRPLDLLRHGLGADDRRYARTSGLAMASRPVWRSFLAEQRVLVQQLPSLTDALGLIQAPTLVLHGSADAMIPRATPLALTRLVANARRAELAGAGHDLHLRRTGEVAEHIAAFARESLGLA